jgi:hypothetical protein
MSLWFDTDKWKHIKGEDESDDDPKGIDFTDLDPVDVNEDITGGPLIIEKDGETLIFGRFSEKNISQMMRESGIVDALTQKGYKDLKTDLQYLSEMDQRIFIREHSEVLIHIRLKLSHFRFRFHKDLLPEKLLYIDWLLTQHPKSKRIREHRLFPGQKFPGLGIFPQIKEFISTLALGVGAKGAFNIPEYFHDAVLFHRDFTFYDPEREAFFRALIRDLHKYGIRKISNGLSDGSVRNSKNEKIGWDYGEMISVIDPPLKNTLWSYDYQKKVKRALKLYRFSISED